MSPKLEVAELDRLCRAEWGRLLSALIRDFGDFDLAEEVLQDAFASALVEWAARPPSSPRGWLYAAARHNAISLKFTPILAKIVRRSPPGLSHVLSSEHAN